MNRTEAKFPALCIDPGINIGMALFLDEFAEPVCTKLIQAQQSKGWDLNSQVVCFAFKHEVRKLFNNNKCIHAFIEKPQFMESHVGLTAARDDSLFKLICIYGSMIYILREIGYTVHPIATNWKGQMKKHMVADRIKRIINMEFPNHIEDAVGIGLWLKGIL
jgi:hypothetical protein